VAVEAIKNLPVGAVSSCWLVDYHHIQARELRLIEPKRLSDDALDSVSAARRAAVLFGDRQAESCRPAVIVAAQHGKPFVAATLRLLEDTTVRRSIEQPVFFTKAVWRAAS